MKKAGKNIRVLLFLGIMFLLIVPFVQNKFEFVKLDPLFGDIKIPERSYLKFKDWFSGDYQQHTEKYLNETFGFRNFFVRMNNQIAYDLFGKTSAKQVVIGKNNMMFEESYIKAYYGSDFIGKDSIMHRMQKLKFIQDTLSKLNKSLIIIFAPGKASFFPEFIPDSCKTTKNITNYDYHIKLAQEYGLNYLDFNRYFIDHKHTSKYPLYPKCGIHWSYYGACLVADSIIHYIEGLRHINMPHLYWNDVEIANPKEGDNDIGDGMNLLFGINPGKLAYPKLKFQSDSGKTKPTVMVVSDSYYWVMYGFGINRTFGNNHFYFYGKKIYPESFKSTLEIKQVNFAEQIAQHEVIIIMATEPTLRDMGWGFIEKLYDLYKKKPLH